MTERHVDDIDADLSSRVARRAELREERREIMTDPFLQPHLQEARLRQNQQRIDAQSESIEKLMDERELAVAHCPDTLDGLMEGGTV
jgi:hypothetical protein